jgi:hypothetical protein
MDGYLVIVADDAGRPTLEAYWTAACPAFHYRKRAFPCRLSAARPTWLSILASQTYAAADGRLRWRPTATPDQHYESGEDHHD